MVTRRRTYVLAGLLVLTGCLTTVLLARVLSTIFFAITVAYVLFPVSEWLGSHGLNKRLSAAVTTGIAFVSGTLIVVPLGAVLYLRRRDLFTFFQKLPPTVTIEFGEFAVPIEIDPTLIAARETLTAVAVDLAAESPVLALKAVLFAILVYAMLWQPQAPKKAVYRTIPASYHEVINRLHQRLRGTLYAIYVLQAATAFGTFVVAWVVFWLLGYQGAFALAVVAGILQFVPVVGPSVVVLTIAVADVINGNITGAILVTVFGLVLIGFLPDAVIRPKLARYTTGLPASLYFVGFTGGVLTLGVIGFIAGPVVIALLVELSSLLTSERQGDQQKLS
ncbi:AI-2E family transporter [Haloarcula argentinensis]|uniref:AI-2E family transporter n=1 Tax=Haloarcula argentinensis TaxID=43776 RepID=A0A830FNF7_HALAR|nr:AI-2E family transporter [Haloarcula argentinensis]GGM41447.1 AI-2E family transporter [Haloarcula argentinensis]